MPARMSSIAQQRFHQGLRGRGAKRGHYRGDKEERRKREPQPRRPLLPKPRRRQAAATWTALAPAEPKRGIGLHRPCGRPHPHQPSRCARRRPDRREAEGRPRIPGEACRDGREDRRGGHQDRGRQSARGADGRQRGGARGAVRLRDRRAVQARLHLHLRRDQRERPQQTDLEWRLFHLGLPPDRRIDQSRQQRRPALRHRREGDWDEHAD